MSRTVAVIGGGYGGAAVAKALQDEADVVLIDPRDAFVNAAASLRALTRPDWAGTMFHPFGTLLTRGDLVRERAVSVDPGGVTLASGARVDAGHVVLATGSNYSYPAKPDSDSVSAATDDLHRTHKELVASGRVLILGAGPVGLELAGEIKETWPDKRVTIVDPAGELLPGYLPPVVEDLRRQLDALDIDVRLGTSLAQPPPVGPGRAGPFTVTTNGGEEIGADIWFRAFGTSINNGYLTDGRLTPLTSQGQVPVTASLNVRGHDHVYAVGDLTDVPEIKRASWAMRHAEVVAANIKARLGGERPTATYEPLPDPMILLPLGRGGGVGQLPSEDGPFVTPPEVVSEYKGLDLFSGRFIEEYGPTA